MKNGQIDDDDFEARLMEVQEMGGDPFFMMDDENDHDVPSVFEDDPNEESKREIQDERRMEIEAMGGDPFFMTDDDGDDEPTSLEAEEDLNEQMMAANIMAKLTMAGGSDDVGAPSILNIVEEQQQSKENDNNPIPQERLSSESIEDDIEAMGGDPFFMEDDNVEDEFDNFASAKEEENDQMIASDILSKLAMTGQGATNTIDSVMGQQNDNNNHPMMNSNVEAFEAKMVEIEAMGGDPFFMIDDDEDDGDETRDGEDEEDQIASDIMAKMALVGGSVGGVAAILNTVPAERRATDGLGPSPQFRSPKVVQDENWEWDGFVDEDAHLDFD